MPAAREDVDRQAVEAHVRQHGVRAACEAFGLPLATVGDWSRQGGWCKPLPVVIPSRAVGVSSNPNGPNKAGQAAVNQLQRMGEKSRVYAGKAVLKGLRTAASLPGEAVIASAPSLASLGKLAVTAKLPGWEAEAPAPALRIEVLARMSSQPVTLDAETGLPTE